MAYVSLRLMLCVSKGMKPRLFSLFVSHLDWGETLLERQSLRCGYILTTSFLASIPFVLLLISLLPAMLVT